MRQWFAIRVSYGRVLKFSAQLQEAGVEHFIPMCRKKSVKDGKAVTLIVPAISNLCFVHADRAFLDEYLRSMGENRTAHFVWDKSTRKPIVVPDKAMEDFIRISRIMADEALYLSDISAKLRVGQKVRVLSGSFKDIEGVVVRVKRSRRVVVELPGLLAIATTYIKPSELEIL